MPAWTRLHWRWFTTRCLALAVLGVIFGGLTFIAVDALRHEGLNTATVFLAGLSAVTDTALFFSARHTWRIWSGASIEDGHMRLESRLLAVIGGLFILFLLVFTPKLLELLRVSSEGANKGALGLVRQELAAHKSAHDGLPPAGLDELIRPGIFPELPDIWRSNPAAPHRRTAAWRPAASAADSGEWAYGDGAVYIDCTHTDIKGNVWNSY